MHHMSSRARWPTCGCCSTRTPSDDAEWPALRQRMGGELDRLRSLIDNLLFLAAHDEHGSMTVPSTRVALDDLLFAEAEMVAATTSMGIDVAGVGPALVTGSTGHLQRMLRNLVDNAARHAHSTVILACTQADDGTVTVVVADDGPGVAPADRERIFERFTRLDEARDRTIGGTGLGLAIVDAVAKDHGAAVTIDYTDPDTATGARFTVTFPASG